MESEYKATVLHSLVEHPLCNFVQQDLSFSPPNVVQILFSHLIIVSWEMLSCCLPIPMHIIAGKLSLGSFELQLLTSICDSTYYPLYPYQ
jgi:hypothetical protein